MKKKIYRVRQGWFGQCILQELVDWPTFNGGVVDTTVRDIHWEDVDYKFAPTALIPVTKETSHD